MKTMALLAAISFAALYPALGQAQGATPMVVAQAMTGTADGEVRKIDREQGKITLKHGPIAGMDMPGMTMIFRVQDPSLLDKAAVGDKVLFSVAKTADGMTVTSLEKAK
ncbi:MAG: copper-binding protein [Alphaproteobacteria bacterium]|jgi:Cu/Ag efflux protein CusF|uniref:copper-binding protein n=1 Tax=Rhizorhabdus sp. TaxID=1968843 RepID=UPI001AD303E3|nr:copper-binding protein [Rhizorhabdus sp.]MBN9529832.1 copper-binding protein [Alphaproteobacteria bacterium]MBP8233310.1 copper-binding protein [Rhizorhabdus sp.]